jgi:hypothetical protein
MQQYARQSTLFHKDFSFVRAIIFVTPTTFARWAFNGNCPTKYFLALPKAKFKSFYFKVLRQRSSHRSHYYQLLPLALSRSLRSALSLLHGRFNRNANGHRRVRKHTRSRGLWSSLRLFFGCDRAPYWLTSAEKRKNKYTGARLSRFAFRFSFWRKDSARVENRVFSINLTPRNLKV